MLRAWKDQRNLSRLQLSGLTSYFRSHLGMQAPFGQFEELLKGNQSLDLLHETFYLLNSSNWWIFF